MKIVATYDMTIDLGSGPEPVLRGQEIDPPGTGIASRDERARQLIRAGAAVLPADWPKYRDSTEAKCRACATMVAEAREANTKHRRARA